MSAPVRVAMLSSVHPPMDVRIFLKEARTLAAAGYDVTYVVPHDRDEQVDGVRLRAFPRARHRLFRMLASPPRMLREALRVQADVYHFHDPELIPVGLALKMLGKRVVYDAHEDVAKSILGKSYLAGWLRRPLAATVNLLEKGASRAFDLVVVAAGGIQTSFRGHAHTLLIRNYPIQESHASLEPAVRDDGRFVVAYAGGLTAERGAVEMVEAIARVPARFEPRLVICGKYWPARLEERVRSMPGFERVDYRGWLSPGRVAAELHRADVGLVCFLPEPNHVEAGPNKLFEYMAAGLPVIASAFPAWREIVEGGDCGLCVNPADPDAIAAAMVQLAEQPQRRAEMGRNGRRLVRERYNWGVEGRRLIDAYALISRRV